MNGIATYILKKYGYMLTADELDIVIQWYEDNKDIIKNEEKLDCEIRSFLYKQFPDKTLYYFREDTSNMNYLLSMLKNRNNS